MKIANVKIGTKLVASAEYLLHTSGLEEIGCEIDETLEDFDM